jgi:hypothetical protein
MHYPPWWCGFLFPSPPLKLVERLAGVGVTAEIHVVTDLAEQWLRNKLAQGPVALAVHTSLGLPHWIVACWIDGCGVVNVYDPRLGNSRRPDLEFGNAQLPLQQVLELWRLYGKRTVVVPKLRDVPGGRP